MGEILFRKLIEEGLLRFEVNNLISTNGYTLGFARKCMDYPYNARPLNFSKIASSKGLCFCLPSVNSEYKHLALSLELI